MKRVARRSRSSGLSNREVYKYVRERDAKEDWQGFSDIDRRLRDSRPEEWPCNWEYSGPALLDLANKIIEWPMILVTGLLILASMALSDAASERFKLVRDVWLSDCDGRRKIGQSIIILVQLSMRQDLEAILDECIELREEKTISEFEFWQSFIGGTIQFAVRRRFRRLWRPAR